MLDIIFINPPLGNTAFPVGIGQLASILEKAGCSVGVIDAASEYLTPTEVVDRVGQLGCRIVGLTGLWSTYRYQREVSQRLWERYPAIFQVAGGWWAGPIPELILEKTAVAVVVRGEADLLIVDLVRAILDGTDLATLESLSFLRDGVVEHTRDAAIVRRLDDLPLPSYNLFDTDHYVVRMPTEDFLDSPRCNLTKKELYARFGRKRELKQLYTYSGRGCYGNCRFCAAAGRKLRKCSPEYVIDHLRFLQENYGPEMFYFGEDLTLSTKKWVDAFCKAIIDSGLNIIFRVNGRGDSNLDDETAALLKEAGCYNVSIGIESGSQQMLDAMDKRTTVEANYHTVEVLRRQGVRVRASFCLNMPGETEETLEETVEFARRAKLDAVSASFASPIPGTWLFQFALEHGFIKGAEELLEVDTGWEKGKKARADFDAYYAKFNFNNIPKERLWSARQRMRETAAKQHLRRSVQVKRSIKRILSKVTW